MNKKFFVATCTIALACGPIVASSKKDRSAEKSAPAAKTSRVQEVTDIASLEKLFSADQLVVVKFSAPWCPHCTRMVEPFASVAEQFPHISFVTINIDKLSTTERLNPVAVDVKGLPTLKIFKGTSLISTNIGDAKKEKIEQFVRDSLSK